jgi:biopolymer transport protein ExbB/TolQ
MMNFPAILMAVGAPAASAAQQSELLYVWGESTIEAKIIIVILVIFSIFAWSVMAAKALQMRRAKRMNTFFDQEFRAQKQVFGIFDRRIQVDGCPNFAVYQAGCQELEGRLKSTVREGRKGNVSLKSMEHVKRALERTVAQESLKLESGLILLAIAVSGAPFLGLLGTVWGVMSTFSGIALAGSASLQSMAPGVSAALITTVAGLLVAIPSMFGYNWLVHTLRVLTVELDNFSQELVSRMEIEFLREDELEAV